MANLKEAAELAWRQMFPNPTDEASVSLEEFIATAKLEYAYQSWRMALEDKQREGWQAISQSLLRESDPLPVKNNKIDITDLPVLRSLPEEAWLQSIGGFNCKCRYVKTTINHYQLLCDDDSLPEGDTLFYVMGKEIRFPNGTKDTEVPVVYATDGSDLDDELEVDDAVAGIVRVRLVEIYGGKIGKEDETNNTSSNT